MKPHTKDELLTPTRDKGDTTIGPHHDGGPRPGHYAKPGEGLLSHPHAVPNHAGMVDHTNVKLALGKTPQPKRAFTENTPIHGGMTVQTHAGEAYGGDHRSAVDALTGRAIVPGKDGKVATEHPLTRIAPGKPGMGPVPRSFGMRSRRNDPLHGGIADASHEEDCSLGQRIIAEAVQHEARPFGVGRGKLAPVTTEET